MTNYIGLMSGTSLDGVDGTLVAFGESDADLQVRAHAHRPFDGALRSELLALNTPGPAELHRAALAANALVGVYADVVKALLEKSGTSRQQVRAIGAHGQTVRHRPGEFDGIGYTVQLKRRRCWPSTPASMSWPTSAAATLRPAVLARRWSRPFTVRSSADPGATVGVLNLGGIANLTVLHRDGRTIGFDCGRRTFWWTCGCTGTPVRRSTRMAPGQRRGLSCRLYSASMQADPYFTRSPPKSTGRDLFDAAWL
jgi:anhydro-N-acetylmuramic acid kinase